MKCFEDIIEPFIIRKTDESTPDDFGREIIEHQGRMNREFPGLIAGSRMRLWKPGDPVLSQGSRFLIGVELTSRSDLRLLDALDIAMRATRRNDRVDVFDCFNLEENGTVDFERYIPGIGDVLGTPVVGVWEDGLLVSREQGWRARKLVIDAFDLALPA